MANKTIHELTELTQGNVGTSQELAIYDVSDNSTKRVTVGNLFGIDEFLTADDDDEPTGQVDFTSEDDELSPTSTESVDLLTGNDSWSQRFYKVSQMFKNIRYILGKLGTTDISSIGNGTVTGALSELNGNLNGVTFSYCAPNSSVTAKTSDKSYAIIYGRRGAVGILAIAWQNAGTAGVNVLAGTASWISVSYNNGLVITSNDAYTSLNIIWN